MEFKSVIDSMQNILGATLKERSDKTVSNQLIGLSDGLGSAIQQARSLLRASSSTESPPAQHIVLESNQKKQSGDNEEGLAGRLEQGYALGKEGLVNSWSAFEQFSSAIRQASNEMQGGSGFIAAMSNSVPLLDDGLQDAKYGLSSLGKAFELGKTFFHIEEGQKPSENLNNEPKNGKENQGANGNQGDQSGEDTLEKETRPRISFKGIGEAIQTVQDAGAGLGQSYELGTQGLEQSQAAVETLNSAFTQASADLQSGKSLFSVIQSTAPLLGQGLDEVKLGLSTIGSAFQTGRDSLTALSGISFSGSDNQDSDKDALQSDGREIKPEKNPEKKDKDERINNKNNVEISDTNAEIKQEVGSDSGALDEQASQLDSIITQGQAASQTLTAAYESGSQGIAQAQLAVGNLGAAWKQASEDLNNGKSFFSTMQSVSPLIGEGLGQAQQSLVSLGETFTHAKQGLEEVKGLANTIGNLFGSPMPDNVGDEEKSSEKNRENGKRKNNRPSKIKLGLPALRSSVGKIVVSSKGGIRQGLGLVRMLSSSMIGLARGAIPAVVGGIRAMGMALMANPIGLVVGGIALAAGLVIRYWEPIKGFFIGLWSGVKSVFSGVWEWIKNAFLNFTPLGLMVKHWQPILSFFSGLWDGVKGIFGAAWSWIKKTFLAPLNALKNTLGKAWGLFFGKDDPGEEKNKSEEKASQTNDEKPKSATVVSINKNLANRETAKPSVMKPAAIALGASLAAAPLAAQDVLPLNTNPATKLAEPSQAASPPQHTVNESHYHINIHASQGLDERKLAILVRQEIEGFEQRKESRQRRRLYD